MLKLHARQRGLRLLLATTGALLASAFGLAYPHASNAATYSACGTGATFGGVPLTCPSLPDALAAATANPGPDTIDLEGGSYCPIALTGANGELSFVGRGFAGIDPPPFGGVTIAEAEASTFTSHETECTPTGTLVQIRDDPYTISFRDVAFEGERYDPNQSTAISMRNFSGSPQAGSLLLQDVILKDNSVGVYFEGNTPARFEMSGSTVSGNGIGVFLTNVAGASITNSTFADNTNIGLSAGNSYAINLRNDTFARNWMGINGGGFGNIINLGNSIVANSGAGDCIGFEIHSVGHNLSTSGCGPGPLDPTDQFYLAFTLAPLDFNGGPTTTILPPDLAVGAANNSTCPLTDQRGFLRADPACDIGAVELFAAPPPPPPPPGNTPVSTAPQTVSLLGGTVAVTFNAVTAAGDTAVTAGATGPAIPVGFVLNGSYYELSTTASFTAATVCITSPTVTTLSRLLHYPGPSTVTRAPVVPPTICSTALSSFSPFAIVEPVLDTTAPSLSVSHVANGSNGWSVSAPVSISISAGDTGSGLAGAPTCTDTFNGATTSLTVTGSFAASVAGDGIHVVTCTASDVAGNTSAPVGDTVKIDTVAPIVSYTGNTVTYTVGQTVNITCTASDASGSGIAATSCVNITGPVSGFTLGLNTFTADASDAAGNVGHGSTSFTVVAAPPPTVTIAGLCRQTKTFIQSSAKYLRLTVFQRQIVDLLATALCNRIAAIEPGLTPAQKAAIVRAYDVGIQALVPLGWLTQAQATTLIGMANSL